MDYTYHYDSPIGGIDKKVKLLTMEKVDMTNFFVPKRGTAL